jgi:hypothetical protein
LDFINFPKKQKLLLDKAKIVHTVWVCERRFVMKHIVNLVYRIKRMIVGKRCRTCGKKELPEHLLQGDCQACIEDFIIRGE